MLRCWPVQGGCGHGGGAAESVILELRNVTAQKLTLLKTPVPKGMEDWRIRTVSEALRGFFEGHAAKFAREMREPFEAYWSAFAQQIRATRNDAGHDERRSGDARYCTCFAADIPRTAEACQQSVALGCR